MFVYFSKKIFANELWFLDHREDLSSKVVITFEWDNFLLFSPIDRKKKNSTDFKY